ncbi:NAC domain [Sesbania bispinosa]|nr:NAC domain [Sesbania bispinosa]
MGTPQSNNLPPGFRFHPTDEELILHYLRKKVAFIPLPVSIIAEVDIYKFDPWELPVLETASTQMGRGQTGAAASGYWKATGTDKSIVASWAGGRVKEIFGVKKSLVFYKGRPPRLDDWVLCRIYKKSKHTLSSTTEEAVNDHEQDQAEEQQLEDTLLPISIKSPVSPFPPSQSTLISQKSLSFSNLLDATDYSMLSTFLSSENHSPTAPFNSGNLNQEYPQNYTTTNSCLFQRNSQSNHSVSYMENVRPKRQLSNIDDEDMLLYPSKKYLISSSCNFPNTTNFQDENPQWNFLFKHSFMNQLHN